MNVACTRLWSCQSFYMLQIWSPFSFLLEGIIILNYDASNQHWNMIKFVPVVRFKDDFQGRNDVQLLTDWALMWIKTYIFQKFADIGSPGFLKL